MNKQLTPNRQIGQLVNPKGWVLHGTLGSYKGAITWLCTPPEKRNPVSYSSAHFVISKKGEITQLAEINDVTWHAGLVSSPVYRARLYLDRKIGIPKIIPIPNSQYKDPNSQFVGCEFELYEEEELTDAQINAFVGLVKQYSQIPKLFLCHKEITDYKFDFSLKGKINMKPIWEVINKTK